MKVVLTHPFCWPYVRRGSERNLDNVARYLVSRGHDVVTISSHPKTRTTEISASGKRILNRPLRVPAMERVHIQETHTFFFPAYRALSSLDPDVVHSFFFTDALAAACARRRRKYRVVFQMNGIALPGISCRRFPPEAWIWRQALGRVDDRMVCSHFVGDLLRRFYGCDYRVIHPPVELSDFPMGAGPADGPPTILSVADFTIPRKGVRVLIDAFRIVKQAERDALLRLSGNMPEWLQADVLHDIPEDVSRDIEILGLGKPGDVAELYRKASVMALPSMWEPSGGSVLEAFASGTPVVATNHGGVPEFVTKEVGVLFDPQTDGQETRNSRGLAEALIAGLQLSRTPGIRQRCRAHVQQYSTEAIGPVLERFYSGA
jgi:glycosyltransferase involved in cell wall biosynthesis